MKNERKRLALVEFLQLVRLISIVLREMSLNKTEEERAFILLLALFIGVKKKKKTSRADERAEWALLGNVVNVFNSSLLSSVFFSGLSDTVK